MIKKPRKPLWRGGRSAGGELDSSHGEQKDRNVKLRKHEGVCQPLGSAVKHSHLRYDAACELLLPIARSSVFEKLIETNGEIT